MERIEMLGKKFGRLTVLERAGTTSGGDPLWKARCDCGQEGTFRASLLREGRTQSCGCLRRELAVAFGKASLRHGEGKQGAETPEYRVWAQMLSRCRNPNHAQFAGYGGRGITVCERWKTYENFLADMGRRPSPRHSLDRIENDGHYEPGNCRWTTWEVQNANRRAESGKRTMFGLLDLVTHEGRTQTIRAWLKELDLSPATYRQRRRKGQSQEQAATTPHQKTGRKPAAG